MKKKFIFLVFLLIGGMVANVSATPILITPGMNAGFGDEFGGQNPDLSAIGTVVDIEGLSVAYKDDDNSTYYFNSYTTSYGVEGTYTENGDTFDLDMNAAIIKYNGGNFSSILGNIIYLLVKDGNGDPGWYIFNISNWNGIDTLLLSGFWPTKDDAISHVTIVSDISPVPEPATIFLLGIGMIGIAGFGRKFK